MIQFIYFADGIVLLTNRTIIVDYPPTHFLKGKISKKMVGEGGVVDSLKALRQPSQKFWPKILTSYFFTVTFT